MEHVGVGIYNQQFQGLIYLMVLDFQGTTIKKPKQNLSKSDVYN